MTRLEQEVLENARHYIPEIADQLKRLADNLETFTELCKKEVSKEE